MVLSIKQWIFAVGVTAVGVTAAVVGGCSGSDDDDTGPICEEDADDSDCEVCIKTGCCDAYTACQNNTDCTCILQCSTENQIEAQCAARCNVTDTEVSDALALLSGQDQTCSVQCEDDCVVYGYDDDDDAGLP